MIPIPIEIPTDKNDEYYSTQNQNIKDLTWDHAARVNRLETFIYLVNLGQLYFKRLMTFLYTKATNLQRCKKVE
jgi:hypothetical protein